MYKKELAIPKKIEDLCEERTRILTHYINFCELLKADKTKLDEYGGYLYPYIKNMSPDSFRKELDSNLWRKSLDKTGLYRYMDAEARRKLNKGLEREVPEFTLENIKATLVTAAQSAEEMFIRGLVNIFRGLSKQHKTNTNEPFKVNEKCITYGAQENYSGGLRLGYYHEDKINDLDRIFKVLDEAEFKPRQLVCDINNAFETAPFIYEDNCFHIKGHKNGNLHITFKRKDLLKKANLLIAKYYGNAVAA